MLMVQVEGERLGLELWELVGLVLLCVRGHWVEVGKGERGADYFC